MPTLNWIGKDAVVNHHNQVPFRTLEKKYSFGEADSDNMIIHGDNLEALKALQPKYEGRIKCIYIDPPYNTGNEDWIYNDNVNSPQIKKWLGQVVGKESEDLTRHDKWLCMMYPRLVLLQRLLSVDGAIFISIDDNEQANLKLICDEIFGPGNFVGVFIVNTTPNARDYGHIGKMHEFCLFYAKDILKLQTNLIPEITKTFKYQDDLGGFNVHPLYNSNVAFTNENRPNLYYPFYLYLDEPIDENFFAIGFEPKENSIEIYPPKSVKDNVQFVWRWGKDKAKNGLINEIIGFKNENGEYRIVQKMRHDSKVIRSILSDKEYTSRRGTAEVEDIFSQKTFSFPKPKNLIEKFVFAATNKDSIVLDSFAGSGTTAHAVLNLNKQDEGNRKFILVEMEDYAESITAERVKRVINGYGENENAVEGTGGGFAFYELGEPIFDADGYLNETVGAEKLREYIWYSETHEPYNCGRDTSNVSANASDARGASLQYLLGNHNGTDYYFYYEPNRTTTLDKAFLNTISQKAEQYVIYADNCLLSESFMQLNHIVFKKIPRDIRKF